MVGEDILTRLFDKELPMMETAPLAVVLLLFIGCAFGTIAAWFLRGNILRAKHEALQKEVDVANREVAVAVRQVEVADRHRDLIAARHEDLSTKLQKVESDFTRLNAEIRRDASRAELTSTSASVAVHMSDVIAASDQLTHTVSGISLTRGRYSEILAPTEDNSTNPPTVSLQGPRPSERPRKS